MTAPAPAPGPPTGLAVSVRSAKDVAQRIYPEPVAREIVDALSFMAQHGWLGDQERLRALIAAVHDEAQRGQR